MTTETDHLKQDPFGLGEIPLLDPGQDGWPGIRQALEAHAVTRRRRKQVGRWLAAAATVILVVGIAAQRVGIEPEAASELAQAPVVTRDGAPAPDTNKTAVHELIAMSQLLERRVRGLREQSAALPAQSAVYIAELEDMIARVDGELSLDPKSVDLWGQRVNLLLDLELIFQHHWEREYGRMAAL